MNEKEIKQLIDLLEKLQANCKDTAVGFFLKNVANNIIGRLKTTDKNLYL